MTARRQNEPTPGLPARQAAFDVACAVASGAQWTRAWEAAGAHLHPGSRDRRFAHELASGSLRLQGRLDWILSSCSTRPLAALNAPVVALLRLGAYQVLEMHAVREHAAVHTTVEIAKRRTPRAAGFVNAVLRSLLRKRGSWTFPDRERDPLLYLETWGSHPGWLVERWVQRFGVDATVELCERNNRRPELCLRVNRRQSDRATLLSELPGSVPGRWSPDAVRCATAGFTAVRRIVESGRASVQDESGMLVSPLLEPVAGSRIVDLAAAPGGKTCHLGEILGDSGSVFAYDRSERRLARLRANTARLGLGNVVVALADARTVQPPAAHGVLLDAPCSGLGVLARRPDLRWRKKPEDVARLAGLQTELLVAAARHVLPGGRLVYSVCSFEPEETDAVAARFTSTHPEFEPEDAASLEALRAGPGLLYFLPHRDRLDGGFVARWRRRGGGRAG